IDGLYGGKRSPTEIAKLANHVERHDLGFPGGSQDSFGSALGDVNLIRYPPGGEESPRHLQLSPETRRTLEHQSLMIYTGGAHVSGEIHADIKRSYAEKDGKTLAALHSLHAQAEEMAVALEAGNLDGYARTLNESCRQLYNLHPGCDCADHRRYFQALREY